MLCIIFTLLLLLITHADALRGSQRVYRHKRSSGLSRGGLVRLQSQELSTGNGISTNSTENGASLSGTHGSILPSEAWGGMAPLQPEAYEPGGNMDILEESAPTVVIDASTLNEKWIDICVEQSRPQDMDKYALRTILPLLLREDSVLELHSDRGESSTDEEVFITEQELKKVWARASHTAMGKPESSFTIEEALLLLPDEEADDVMFDGAHDGSVAAEAAALLKSEDTELYITEQELESVWKNRGEVQWGLPRQEFDPETALLLLDTDEDEEVYMMEERERERQEAEEAEAEEAEAEEGGGLTGEDPPVSTDTPSGETSSTLDHDETDSAREEGDEEGGGNLGAYAMVEDSEASEARFDPTEAAIAAEEAMYVSGGKRVKDWVDKKYNARSDAFLRDQIRRMHADLDGHAYLRPAWKKNRHILTPDIDTQSFMGDMMMSNLYMTTRVPANWNDPELEDMSQTYHECGTMAWPGEEETDYNAITQVWDYLQLPFSPENVLHALEELAAERGVAFEDISRDLGVTVSDGEKIDAGLRLSITPAGSATGSGRFVDVDESGEGRWGGGQELLDDDDFRLQENVASTTSGEGGGDALDVDKFFSQLSGGGTDDEDEEEEVLREITSPLEPTETNPRLIRKPKFATPSAWVDDNPEFATHVDFDRWSQHLARPTDSENDSDHTLSKEWYDADDSVWIDDIAVANSVKHLIDVTDDTLTDHLEITQGLDELKMWRRAIAFKFSGGEEGDQDEVEAIPAHLTPDKEDGVVYSDELIEMKGRVTLAAHLPPPAELFADDKFDHNDEFTTINKIGTVREQYDWAVGSRDPADMIIDESILGKIGSVLLYVNHAAELVSTKDNVLVFDYKGQMRHIVGIRAAMMSICRDVCPEITDIRLETERNSDKFDGTFIATK